MTCNLGKSQFNDHFHLVLSRVLPSLFICQEILTLTYWVFQKKNLIKYYPCLCKYTIDHGTQDVDYPVYCMHTKYFFATPFNPYLKSAALLLIVLLVQLQCQCWQGAGLSLAEDIPRKLVLTVNTLLWLTFQTEKHFYYLPLPPYHLALAATKR